MLQSIQSFISPTTQWWRRIPSQGRLALFGFFVSILVIVGLIAAHLFYNYRETARYAEQHLQSAASSYAALADHNFIEASQFLTEIANIVDDTMQLTPAQKQSLQKASDFRRKTSPQIAGVFLLDDKDALRFGRRYWKTPPPQLIELQKSLHDHKSTEPALSNQPVLSDQNQWLWPLGRRINKNGNYAGAAIVLLDVSAFLNQARALAGNEDILVGLTSPNHDFVLVDYQQTEILPLEKLDSRMAGMMQQGADDFVGYQYARRDVPDRMKGTWLVAMKRLEDEPIYTVLSRKRESWISGWQRQMITLTLVGIAISALLGMVTWSSVRQAFLQQRVQRDLAKARERYDLAVSGVEDGIWDWDLETNEIYFSPVWFRILGYHSEELPSQTTTWSSNVHHDDLDAARTKLQSHLDGQIPLFHDRHRMRTKDGSYIWIEAKARAVRDPSGYPVRMVGTIVNVEREKQHEIALQNALRAAEAASRSKTRFLANMSHELRTPLNGIIGFSEITRDQLFGPVGSAKYVEYAHDIHSGALHLLNLINDILDFSKIDAGKYQINPVKLDPVDAIESTMRMVRSMAADRGVKLKFPAPDMLPMMHADDRALRQMLLNLISNAIKFSKQNGIVTIEAGMDSAEGIWIRVTDNGIGIPVKDQDRIFEPFEQVDDILTRQHEGTGLGLPLVKALIEQHGGSVDLMSEVGMGTAITLHFPPTAVAEEPTKRSA